MIMQDTTTEIHIEPALHEDIAVDEQIIYQDVPFTVSFAQDTTELNVSTNNLISHSINLLEIVN